MDEIGRAVLIPDIRVNYLSVRDYINLPMGSTQKVGSSVNGGPAGS